MSTRVFVLQRNVLHANALVNGRHVTVHGLRHHFSIDKSAVILRQDPRHLKRFQITR